MLDMLLLAAKIALPSNDHSTDYRRFWLGCVGVRSDGPMIFSKNGAAMFSTPVKRYQLIPTSHAECRTIQKMDSGGTIYVARVSKKDGSLALAMPCTMCQNVIKARGIKKVYFTIDKNTYGFWDVRKNTFKTITCKS